MKVRVHHATTCIIIYEYYKQNNRINDYKDKLSTHYDDLFIKRIEEFNEALLSDLEKKIILVNDFDDLCQSCKKKKNYDEETKNWLTQLDNQIAEIINVKIGKEYRIKDLINRTKNCERIQIDYENQSYPIK